jgi:hypothetical protein
MTPIKLLICQIMIAFRDCCRWALGRDPVGGYQPQLGLSWVHVWRPNRLSFGGHGYLNSFRGPQKGPQTARKWADRGGDWWTTNCYK